MVLSLAVHAVAGLALAGAWRWDGGNPLRIDASEVVQEEPEHERPPIRLGIERSNTVTMTWLGFATPTEHSARQSEVEQSALSATPAPAITPAPDPAPSESVRAESAPEASARSSRVLVAVRSLAQTIGERAVEVAQIAEQAIAVGLEDAAAAILVEASGADSTATPTTTSGETSAEPSGSPGLQAPKESPPTALDSAIRVVPGKVAAGQGLEIFTQRPRWPLTTLALRAPRNPVLQITFGPDGRVTDARFARDGQRELSTGFSDVDEPLLTAVYRWTARGKALDELPADDPKAGVTVNLRIILQGG